jgi:hypothetical protein
MPKNLECGTARCACEEPKASMQCAYVMSYLNSDVLLSLWAYYSDGTYAIVIACEELIRNAVMLQGADKVWIVSRQRMER